MSNVELPLPPHRLTREIQPRHPHREIAGLLAAGILRARQNSTWTGDLSPISHSSEVCLGFNAEQSVNANPSYTEGVRE
jgi:hypothetical protein